MKLSDRLLLDPLSLLPGGRDTQAAAEESGPPPVSPERLMTHRAVRLALEPAMMAVRASAETVEASRRISQNEVGPQQLRAQLEQRLDASASGPIAMVMPEEGFSNVPGQGLTFTGTSGDDSYTMRRSQDGRDFTITNDKTGRQFSVDASRVDELTINTGAGDDVLNVEAGGRFGTSIDMGHGNDRVNVGYSALRDLRIDGGTGHDTLDASRSFSSVRIQGGEGNDIIRGGSSDDVIGGGAGDDWIHGGAGDDQVFGHGGSDRVSGGAGHDVIHGGEGSDALDGGTGMDSIYADENDWFIEAGKRFGPGKLMDDDHEEDLIIKNGHDYGRINLGSNDVLARYDRSDTEAWLQAHPRIKIEGSDDFRERTIADLGAIRFTDQGRQLTDEVVRQLDQRGRDLTISANSGRSGTYRDASSSVTVTNQNSRRDSDGSMASPLTLLFHELVHAQQFGGSDDQLDVGRTRLENGSVYNNTEFQATGLAYYDRDGQLRSKDDYQYSENKFRRELGLTERQAYGPRISRPVESATPRRRVPPTPEAH